MIDYIKKFLSPENERVPVIHLLGYMFLISVCAGVLIGVVTGFSLKETPGLGELAEFTYNCIVFMFCGMWILGLPLYYILCGLTWMKLPTMFAPGVTVAGILLVITGVYEKNLILFVASVVGLSALSLWLLVKRERVV